MQTQMENVRKKTASRYCDHDHDSIVKLSRILRDRSENPITYVKRAFRYVREEIVFGGDLWQVKASETLRKGYGACYNKNLLLNALLHAGDISCRLGAYPMKRTFMRPAMGFAYLGVSEPFYHCFTQVTLDGNAFIVDPTLDRRTYDTFFGPLKVGWDVSWRDGKDMVLYTESILGPSILYGNIDEALDRCLDSHFLFRDEPFWLLRIWLAAGNGRMWSKTGRRPRGEEFRQTDFCLSIND